MERKREKRQAREEGENREEKLFCPCSPLRREAGDRRNSPRHWEQMDANGAVPASGKMH